MFVNAQGLVVNDGAYALNGVGSGPFGGGSGTVRWESGLRRPFLWPDRNRHVRPHVQLQVGWETNNATGEVRPKTKLFGVYELQQRGINHPVWNTGATLTRDAWIEIDRVVLRAVRQPMRAWADLMASSSRGGFNAMGRYTLEYQTMNDVGEAVVDMDALSDSRNDRPLFDVKSIPLPITHADFWFSERELAVSRNSEAALDTTMTEMSGRRVGEVVERTTIGTETGMTFGTRSTGPFPHTGTSTVYGYTNFPYRITKTDLHSPSASSPEQVVEDILEMLDLMNTNGYYGPFILYHSTGYSRFFRDDYFRTGGTSAVRTLRERLGQIEDITDIRRLNFLTSGYQLILAQMDPMVAQAINGMEVTTVQWDSQGGLRHNFKIMCIQVPLLRAPYNGVTGIVHGTTS